ncbi:glycosyl transferase group 1 [Candidatus Vecturithrix granuli]|uniref:Glycosyl transferase group 1 n=1 Tax=Vecturithrix granuli TaxID=1499967 RepID=A0A081C1F7_VECG1|nr:glycosyl transferase group 1 [Candidatus Vecturithrix granuli]
MKSLCFLNSNRVWGGGEKWHHDVVLRFKEAGYPVLAITNHNSDLLRRLSQKELVLYHPRISTLSFLNPVKILTIARLLRQHRVQAIFLNSASDLKLGGIAAKIAGVPQIIYRRGIALPVKDRWLNRWLFQRVLTRIITNSQETRRLLLEQSSVPIPADKIRVIYNGIDLSAWDQQPFSPVYHKIPREVVLGAAGRLSAEKGHTAVLELTRILKERGICCKTLIAGIGPLAEQLQQKVRNLGIEQEVVFLGFVNQIKNFMESIDIFVLPSLYEGAANVILEAMASRKPVAAFDVSSNPELIQHGQTGFLAQSGNMQELAAHVNNLAQHPELQIRFGQQARIRIEEYFTMERVISELAVLI